MYMGIRDIWTAHFPPRFARFLHSPDQFRDTTDYSMREETGSTRSDVSRGGYARLGIRTSSS